MTLQVSNKGLPTVGAIEWRSTLYPVSKNYPNINRDTTHGEVKMIKGRCSLTARHRDYIDAILANKEQAVFDKTGQLTIVFDEASIRNVLNIRDSRWKDLKSRLVDVMTTVIAIKRPGDVGKWPDTFPILTFIGECETFKAVRKKGQYETGLKKITLSKGTVELMTQDAVLYINKELMNYILGAKHQITRSIIKWMLTHSKDQHHTFANMLKYVGADNCQERQKYKYLRQLREEIDRLKELGITIIGDTLADTMIYYERDFKKVFIEVIE